MKRGEIWTVAGGAAYVGKPRPAPRGRFGRPIGSLTSEEMRAVNRAIFVFLGLSETEVERW